MANDFIQNVVKDTVELRPLVKSSTLVGNSVQATTDLADTVLAETSGSADRLFEKQPF